MAKIPGTSGNDHLIGTNSDDTMDGGAGNDKMEGLGGNDDMDGGTGNDIIAGGAGNNSEMGGDGDDTFVVVGGNNTLDGGAGLDTVDYSTEPLSVGHHDTYIGIEHVIGSSGEDTINLNVNSNVDSTVEGHDGDDVITTGSGNDHLSGGNGDDILRGGTGHNVYDGGGGFDTVDESSLAVADKGTSTFTSIENIVGSSHNDSYTFTGNSNITIDGGAGDDVVTGGSASDTLTGGQGNDIQNGGAGNDLLLALGNSQDDAVNDSYDADGKNTMSGGDGNDRIIGAGNNDTMDGGAGSDHLFAGGGNNHLTGGTGSDIFEFLQQEGSDPRSTEAMAPPSHDVVTDFNAQQDFVLIDTSVRGYDPFQHMTQTTAGVVIDLGDGQSVTLDNTHLADLNSHNVQTDFIGA
jgi:Ca2+-binding RTX toxin-like protein